MYGEYTKKALRLVFDNGYYNIDWNDRSKCEPWAKEKWFENFQLLEEKKFLEVRFWKILGKSLNWNKNYSCEIEYHRNKPYPEWQWNMHRFIDHIADGKNINDFFKNIIEK